MAQRPVLVAIWIVVLAATGCGGAHDPDDATSSTMSQASASATAARSPTPATSAASTPDSNAPAEPELVGFNSPTGTIGCVFFQGSVRCDVAEHTWDLPPRPADCEFGYGQGLSISAGAEPEIVCAGDTTLFGDYPTLAYGESVTVGALRCDSAEDGVTCRDTKSGHGFVVARESYETF